MARPVETAYLERIRFVNRVNVVYVRDAYPAALFSEDLEKTREKIAAALGCAAHEIALTRSGTEALQNLIVNYNRLTPGDSVLYSDLDFDAMQFAMDFLAQRRGVNIVRFNIPEPASHANILETYERVLRTANRPKLLLLTHISHRTGLVMPIAEIAAMAKKRGVETIVDAAQSWGQLDFKVADLNSDFIGFSLHKWIGSPLGTGCLYVKASRLKDIDPHFENRDWPQADIRSRVLMGSSNFAGFLTVPNALAFHTSLGPKHKEARLRHLRDYWVERVRDIKNIEIITPDHPSLHAGITAFRCKGMVAPSLQNQLAVKYRILTAARKGIAQGDAVRVTPALNTLEPDLDQFVSALRDISTKTPAGTFRQQADAASLFRTSLRHSGTKGSGA
jgi:isopenicillin-N epimerase